jgi:GNAT superfamily N-acetyltransferase
MGFAGMIRPAMTRLRSARPDEYVRLNEIEQTADELYATVGLGIVLDMPTAAHEKLAAGPLWVAVDDADQPIGFLLAGEIDGFAYIDQLSVLPEHGRKGIGGRLIAAAVEWARGTGAQAIVLGTYRDVPWNQPFYEKHGFVEMPESEWDEEIREARAHEARLGHDISRRLFMWRKLR